MSKVQLDEEVNSFVAAGLFKVLAGKHTVLAQSKATVHGDFTLLILISEHLCCVQSQVNRTACGELQNDMQPHWAF